MKLFQPDIPQDFQESRTSRLSGGLELRLLSRPHVIVGGIVTFSTDGEIQLVWHLMVPSKEKPPSLLLALSLSPS